MNKIITISLNGNAYQIEEDGHEALRSYLDNARNRLADNPDRDEIMRDLEQAVADKLQRFLGAHKSVVTGAEVAQAIAEMGPVESEGTAEEKTDAGPAPKKLYRIAQGAMFAGVANGLSAYLNIDVVFIRIIFVLLAVVSGGAWIVAYIAMAILIPRAYTPEQVSRASGAPFNAQEVIDRARQGYDDIRANAHRWRQERHEWKRQWREEKRKMKWEARQARACTYHYHHHSVIGELVQIAVLVTIAWGIYNFIPATRPFYQTVGADIQQGWAWSNAEVTR